MTPETDPRAALDQAARLLDYAAAAFHAQDSLEAADIKRLNRLLEDVHAWFAGTSTFRPRENTFPGLEERVRAELVARGLRKPEETGG